MGCPALIATRRTAGMGRCAECARIRVRAADRDGGRHAGGGRAVTPPGTGPLPTG
jgi:hypothetical protein